MKNLSTIPIVEQMHKTLRDVLQAHLAAVHAHGDPSSNRDSYNSF